MRQMINKMTVTSVMALIINLAVCAVWYVAEYEQFGELQFNRHCDNIVGFIYFLVIWYLLYKAI